MTVYRVFFLISMFFTEVQAGASLINSLSCVSKDSSGFDKQTLNDRLQKLSDLRKNHQEEKELEREVEELVGAGSYAAFFLSDKSPDEQYDPSRKIVYTTSAERVAILQRCKEEVKFYHRIKELDLTDFYFSLFPKESYDALRLNRFASDEKLNSINYKPLSADYFPPRADNVPMNNTTDYVPFNPDSFNLDRYLSYNEIIKTYRKLYKNYQELSHAVNNYDTYLESTTINIYSGPIKQYGGDYVVHTTIQNARINKHVIGKDWFLKINACINATDHSVIANYYSLAILNILVYSNTNSFKGWIDKNKETENAKQ